jgi:biotin carboxyl carrier protein
MQKTGLIQANGQAKEMTVNAEELSQDRHTEDMQEIITKVPSWILRWGITLFFGILLMVVGISVLVRYPDTIKGGLKIESSVFAQPVMAVLPCRITKVFIKKGENVKKGQMLATICGYSGLTEVYTLIAPQDGKAAFVSIVQPGGLLKAGQEVFVIHPANEQFFGVMQIPENNIGKIKTGQQVQIKLRNYPAEEYGQLKGTISYITDEPVQGFFTVKVTLITSQLKHPVELKSWMTADAEIITESVSLQRRLLKTVLNRLN